MTEALMACHVCDALCRHHEADNGERVHCPRCGSLLQAPRSAAMDRLLALSMAVIPLMVVGLTAPFLSLARGGVQKHVSVLDAIAAAATSDIWQFSILVALAIVILPAFRAAALCYALLPVRLGFGSARHARAAFRLADRLRSWSMAEIFVIGVAVALIKVSGMATVTIGPAFWSFVVLGVIALTEDAILCRRSVWDQIT